MKSFVLILFGLVACAKAPDGWNAPVRPWLMKIDDTNRYGADDDWTKGFNDGCVTGLDDSRGVYQMLAPKIDGWKLTGRNPENPDEPHPEIQSARTYSRAWFDGFEHCTYQYDWWVL
jgi:hypothetical protein